VHFDSCHVSSIQKTQRKCKSYIQYYVANVIVLIIGISKPELYASAAVLLIVFDGFVPGGVELL
jgi:hypothetical protein